MLRFIFVLIVFFSSSKFVFADDVIENVQSNFDIRHSLMPIETKAENNVIDDKKNIDILEQKKDDNIDANKFLNDNNIEENKNIDNKIENIKITEEKNILIDNSEVNKDIPEALNEAIVPKLSDNKVENDVNYEKFELKQIPEKKYDGTDIIFSNVIDEKQESKVIKPLIISDEVKKERMLKKQKENENNLNKINNLYSIKSKAHVASYNTESSAYDGYKILGQKYLLINKLTPIVKYEYVEGKGWFYRLYLSGEKESLELLCNDMKKNNDWCHLID